MSGVACMTEALPPLSVVNNSFCAHGSQVEPSIVGIGVPSACFVASRSPGAPRRHPG
jgi:hypothetical protein